MLRWVRVRVAALEGLNVPGVFHCCIYSEAFHLEVLLLLGFL